jgi:hypothetical protein
LGGIDRLVIFAGYEVCLEAFGEFSTAMGA